MGNRFEIAHASGKGTITPNQEKFLISQPPVTLARYRRELMIFGAIPKLSKQQAWKLINRISQDAGGGVA